MLASRALSGFSELPDEERLGLLIGLSVLQADHADNNSMHGLQVEEHDDRESSWFVYDNKVYDATKFLANHPGGPESILIVAGQVLSCSNLCASSVDFVICQPQVSVLLLRTRALHTAVNPAERSCCRAGRHGRVQRHSLGQGEGNAEGVPDWARRRGQGCAGQAAGHQGG